jgi:hypothetical protein
MPDKNSKYSLTKVEKDSLKKIDYFDILKLIGIE